MTRLPLQAIMQATTKLLQEVQDVRIYEYVDKSVKFPFITFGDVEVTPNGVKETDIFTVNMELIVFSQAHTRAEVNSILSDLHVIFDAVRLDLRENGFSVMSCIVTSASTAKAEDTGYAGTINIVFTVQKET